MASAPNGRLRPSARRSYDAERGSALGTPGVDRGQARKERVMIRKLKTGEYRLYSRKADPKTKKRRNLGTFKSRAAAEKHEREVQYFKKH
jgi:hypothetical protein